MRSALRVSALALLLVPVLAAPAGAQHRRRGNPFRHDGRIAPEASVTSPDAAGVTAAPSGFDNATNGYLDQGAPFDELDEESVQALRSFNDNRFIFEEVEVIDDGLGPTYNAQSCRECHQNVVTGGASQIAEHRTGRTENGEFFESLGGSLIQSRATHPDIVERVAFEDDIRTFRISTNTLGSGSSRASPTARCWLFATVNQRLCVVPPSMFPYSKPGVERASDGSAGKGSMPALSRLRLMPISTKWGSPVRHQTGSHQSPCRASGKCNK
jgi:hypothetical protein